MRNIVYFLLKRSLGLQPHLDMDARPALPSYHIQEIELASHRDGEEGDVVLRDCVILGFVPGSPNKILTLLNGTRIVQTWGPSRHTLCVWSINTTTLRAQRILEDWTVTLTQYQSLTKAATAYVGPSFVQVLAYCADTEEGTGHVEIRHLADFASISRSYCLSGRARAWCSTVEASSARVCFAHAREYTTILLRTRCIFFFHKAWCDLPADIGLPYRSTEPAQLHPSGSQAGFHFFELDILVESLMKRQKHVFGLGAASRWLYLPVYDTRSKIERDLVLRKAQETRAHNLNVDRGTQLIVGIMADDHVSLLLLTLFIDPTLRSQCTDFKDTIILEAKRWQLRKSSKDGQTALRNAIEKVYRIDTGEHHCRERCVDWHRDNETVVLAEYEADGSASLSRIEGEYYDIVGNDWRGSRVD